MNENATINDFSLDQMLSAWEERLNNTPNSDKSTTWLVELYRYLYEDIEAIGRSAETSMLQKTALSYELAFVCYEWLDHAKLFFLLIRDSLFERQKINLLLADHACSINQKNAIWQTSIKVLQEAFASLKKEATTNKFSKKKKIKHWIHQQNPWEIYKKQLSTINSQMDHLVLDASNLGQCQQQFKAIEALLLNTLDTVSKTLEAHQSSVESILDMLQYATDSNASKKLLVDIQENINNNVQKIPIDIFQDNLYQLFPNDQPPIQPIIAIRGGDVETRLFSPKNDIVAWLTAAIYPLLFELWEILDREESSFKMLLVNLNNRMEIVYQNTPNLLPEDRANLLTTISTFNNNLIHNKDSVDKLAQLVQVELQTYFKVSLLFNTQQYFLPVSLQATLNGRFWQKEEGWIYKIKIFLKNRIKHLAHLKAKYLEQEPLSISERMVNALKRRQVDAANKHYTSIFMTKGYVGDSFIVGRETELERIASIVNDWQGGYRGALLFYGERFSGKTTLLEIVARRFFNNNGCRLSPNSLLNINGRKFKTSSNLKEALDFVCKYHAKKAPVVLIDDLELWQSDKAPFFQNIHHLSQCIDAYSKKIFFIVTTNSFLQRQLQTYCDFNKVFQAQIDLSTLSKAALQQAISIRHGATHKKLVNLTGDDLPNGLLDKYISKLHKNCYGNIGEGLLRWVNSTSFHNENSIIYDQSKYTNLPVFMNEDTLLIIELLLKYKQSNEHILRHLLGKPFDERYKTVLKRLSSMKLIRRNLDGSIEIQPTIVNDLKHMIE